MDHNLFSLLPKAVTHVHSLRLYVRACSAKCRGMPAGRDTKPGESGRRGLQLPGSTVSVGSVNRNLSIFFCCSCWLISRTVALAGCVGQKLVRENPWQDALRCRVTNLVTAGFLVSCKKFKWRGASVHMGCHSPTVARVSWYGPDSWLIDLIHCLHKQT